MTETDGDAASHVFVISESKELQFSIHHWMALERQETLLSKSFFQTASQHTIQTALKITKDSLNAEQLSELKPLKCSNAFKFTHSPLRVKRMGVQPQVQC